MRQSMKLINFKPARPFFWTALAILVMNVLGDTLQYKFQLQKSAAVLTAWLLVMILLYLVSPPPERRFAKWLFTLSLMTALILIDFYLVPFLFAGHLSGQGMQAIQYLFQWLLI